MVQDFATSFELLIQSSIFSQSAGSPKSSRVKDEPAKNKKLNFP
jgi:hypothetical protein